MTTDHIGIRSDILTASHISPPRATALNYQNMDRLSIANHLNIVDWRNLFASCAKVHEMYSQFVACCTTLIDTFNPPSSSSLSRDAIAPHIARMERKLAQSNPANPSSSKKLTRAALRQRAMLEQKLDFRDSRSSYRYSNTRLKGHEPIPTLKCGSSLSSTPRSKGDHLADHFASVFSPRVPTPHTRPPPPDPATPILTVKDRGVLFSEGTVFQHLASVPSKGSFTPDGIPPIFLKTFREFLAEPLALIFQRSYEDGEVPDLFRAGIVTPIHKKGSKDSAENYRPVSQCVIACLVFEKILVSHMQRHLQLNDLLDPHQHGFVPRKSTSTQRLHMTQDFAQFLNSDTDFHAGYFDLKAAFDRVKHSLLSERHAGTSRFPPHPGSAPSSRTAPSRSTFRSTTNSRPPEQSRRGSPKGGPSVGD